MISSGLARRIEIPLLPILKRIKVSPNALTLTGFFLTSFGAYIISFNFPAGGAVILQGSLFDSLDGMVARANHRTSALGAYLDSVLDRYSDAFIFLGVAYHFRDNPIPAALSLGALAGAYLVSYTRARAEGLGVDCKVGIMERPERIILITAGAMSGFIVPALWVLLVFTHFTALQRIAHTRKELAMLKTGKTIRPSVTVKNLPREKGSGTM